MHNHHLPAWAATVHHDGSPYYVRPAHSSRGTLLRLRAALAAPLRAVFLRTCPDGEQTFTPLQRAADDAASQWWQAELPLRMPRTNYRFLLVTDAGNWWLNAAGLTRHTPTDASDFRVLANYRPPSWLRDAVFYQIFPDRFADGDPANNVRNGEYRYRGRAVLARSWNEKPNRATGGIEFFGGDLQGIAQKLDYLADLGVSAIYLNPIFLAPSNHKYDIEDYTQIDPHLGGEAGLIALRQALDARGMHLMLDVVPNHCGVTHHWFRAAQADPSAPTAEFFTFHHHPDDYECWLGVKTLPKLNYRSLKLRLAFYEGPDAIMRHWLRPPYRIDGWRVDVANMLARQGESQLGHKIGRAVRRAVKEEAPDAYLLGENFFDGSPHLQGDELDATMNYRGFSMPLLHWLAGFDLPGASQQPWGDRTPLPTAALAEQWRAFLAGIPWQVAVQQYNLLGSHDTPRVLWMLGDNQARLRVAVTLLFTYPGVPSVYYGDEVGLNGGSDPECRAPMPWDAAQWDHELRAFYQRLIALRRSSPALRWGGLHLLYAEGETVAFLRESVEEKLVVVARRSGDELAALPVYHAGLADGTRLRDILSGAETVVQQGHVPLVGLGAIGAQIWQVQA